MKNSQAQTNPTTYAWAVEVDKQIIPDLVTMTRKDARYLKHDVKHMGKAVVRKVKIEVIS